MRFCGWEFSPWILVCAIKYIVGYCDSWRNTMLSCKWRCNSWHRWKISFFVLFYLCVVPYKISKMSASNSFAQNERLSCWNNTRGKSHALVQHPDKINHFWNLWINLLFRRHFIHPCVKNTHVDLSDLRNLFLSLVNCQSILSTSNLPFMSYFWYSQLCFYLIDWMYIAINSVARMLL